MLKRIDESEEMHEQEDGGAQSTRQGPQQLGDQEEVFD